MASNKPWEEMHIHSSMWYRMKNAGCKTLAEYKEYKRIKHSSGSYGRGRASGLIYENPPEKIERLRQEYADDVPPGVIEEWINSL